MKRGPLIVFEGGDGSGKSTQLELCVRRLQELPDVGFRSYREPGSTEIGDEIRMILQTKWRSGMDSLTEFLLFAAARSQLTIEKVQAAMAKGKVVLLDRYIYSSIAYQGYGRGVDQTLIKMVNLAVTRGVEPDLVLLYDIDPELALGRSKKPKDRIESERLEFHQRARQGYLDCARNDPKFVVLDGTKEMVELHNRTMEELFSLLKGWGNWTFDS